MERYPYTVEMRFRALRMLLLVPLLSGAAGPVPAAAQAEPRRDPVREALSRIEVRGIRSHLAFLSDDLLEGRAPGTRGERLAVRYIATQLERSGVAPPRGGWFQSVPLMGWRPDARSMVAEARGDGEPLVLRYPSDVVLWHEGRTDTASVSGEVVFVGYGVHAPEYEWDDYKDRDLTGRIALVLVNEPPSPPGQPLIFDGPALTYYGRWMYKVEEAERRGAAAVLIVHSADAAGYPWRVVESSWTGEQLALRGSAEDTTTSLAVRGWITTDAARRLLALGEHDFAELFVRAARRDFQPVATGVELRLAAGGRTRRIDGTNVIGVVHGSDPARRDDAVVFTAHHDHLGIGAAVRGDSIYNGAYDNASGVALLLEIAAAFASLESSPDRSILFLFPTAEEPGMLGSTHYVRNPVFPLRRTVAALNIDGANLWGETEDIGAVGLERSTLGTTFEKHATALGLRVVGERAPESGFFFRSDHFPFARAGVPALYLDHGLTYRGRPAGWGETVLAEYHSQRYHQPGDTYDPEFDLAGAVQQGRHAFLVAYDVANADSVPRWHPGGRVLPATRTAPGGSERR